MAFGRYFFVIVAICIAQISALALHPQAHAQESDEVTIFIAQKILTLDPGMPEATAVAVQNGRVAAIGALEDMKPWIDGFPFRIDPTFADKVLVPGFIAAHEHPMIAANTITQRPLVAFYPTPNPFGPDIEGVPTKEAALARLRDFAESDPDDTSTIFSWGYDVIAMGGHLTKDDLDTVSTTRPVLVWDSSVHFAYSNSAFLEARDITAADAETIGGIILGKDGTPNGQFMAVEAAAFALTPEISKSFANLDRSLGQVIALNRQAGITTTTDLSFGVINREAEEAAIPAFFNDPNIPMRIVIVADAETYARDFPDDPVGAVKQLAGRNTDKVYFSGVKFFADDAFLTLAMALRPPGYIDPELYGIWNTPPERMVAVMLPWWEGGLRIHIHTNGDASQEAVIAALAEMQARYPRFDHRFVFEHFGLSTPSVNPSYVHLRAELNAEYLGKDRAALASRLRTLVDSGVPTAIHSDLPVSPADPLFLMWQAVNRFGQSGAVLGPDERVTPAQALRMVTIDAAYVLGMDDKIGSISIGKFADFTVLEQDPLGVPPEAIRDVPVWGTVVSGEKFPAPPKQMP